MSHYFLPGKWKNFVLMFNSAPWHRKSKRAVEVWSHVFFIKAQDRRVTSLRASHLLLREVDSQTLKAGEWIWMVWTLRRRKYLAPAGIEPRIRYRSALTLVTKPTELQSSYHPSKKKCRWITHKSDSATLRRDGTFCGLSYNGVR